MCTRERVIWHKFLSFKDLSRKFANVISSFRTIQLFLNRDLKLFSACFFFHANAFFFYIISIPFKMFSAEMQSQYYAPRHQPVQFVVHTYAGTRAPVADVKVKNVMLLIAVVHIVVGILCIIVNSIQISYRGCLSVVGHGIWGGALVSCVAVGRFQKSVNKHLSKHVSKLNSLYAICSILTIFVCAVLAWSISYRDIGNLADHGFEANVFAYIW